MRQLPGRASSLQLHSCVSTQPWDPKANGMCQRQSNRELQGSAPLKEAGPGRVITGAGAGILLAFELALAAVQDYLGQSLKCSWTAKEHRCLRHAVCCTEPRPRDPKTTIFQLFSQGHLGCRSLGRRRPSEAPCGGRRSGGENLSARQAGTELPPAVWGQINVA